MKTKLSIIELILLIALFLSCSATGVKLEREDFVLYNVNKTIQLQLIEPFDFANSKLGAALEDVPFNWPTSGVNRIVYENIILYCQKELNGVIWLDANKPYFKTKRGLKVGDHISKIYHLYSKEEIASENWEGKKCSVYIKCNADWLGDDYDEAVLKIIYYSDRVISIQVYCS